MPPCRAASRSSSGDPSGGWNFGMDNPSSSQTRSPQRPNIAPSDHRNNDIPTLFVALRTRAGVTKIPEPWQDFGQYLSLRIWFSEGSPMVRLSIKHITVMDPSFCGSGGERTRSLDEPGAWASASASSTLLRSASVRGMMILRICWMIAMSEFDLLQRAVAYLYVRHLLESWMLWEWGNAA